MDARLPFSVEDATRPDDPNRPETDDANAEPQFKRVLLETRLNNRVIDLRVNQFSVVECHHTLMFFADYHQSSYLQTAECHRRFVPSVFERSRIYRDPQSQTTGRGDGVRRICI